VRAAEGRVHEIARPRAALGHRQLVAVLGGALDLVEVAEVDHRVDALREQVETERDEVDVAGALAVAEQASLDPVGARHVAELGRGDRGTAVVVRVQAEDHAVSPGEIARHPLDRVGVDVGGHHLHGGRQVQDDGTLGSSAEGVDHLVADVDRELELGARVALGRVLVVHVDLGHGLLRGLAQAGALERDIDDALLVGAEHDVALQHARGVVEVHDGLLRAGDRLVGAVDERLAGLRQHLDRDVIRDQVLLDEAAHEVEVGLARRREAHLDLLVAHAHEEVEHDALALGAHGVDERLVSVTQVDGAPAGRARDALGGPGAVGQVDGELLVVRTVLVNRHARRLLCVLHGLCISRSKWSADDKHRDEGGLRLGLVAAAKEKQTEQHLPRVALRPAGLHCRKFRRSEARMPRAGGYRAGPPRAPRPDS
jgi:hypothetical protein